MIRINLLPVKQSKKHTGIQQQLIIFVALVIVTVAVLYSVQDAEISKIGELKAEQADLKKELKRLQELIGNIDKEKAKKNELTTKLKVITDLKKNKRGPVRLLDELSIIIPKKVWLERLLELPGSRLQMVGYVVDHRELSTFMNNLEKSPFFDNVVLELDCKEGTPGCAGKSDAPMSVYQFSLSVKFTMV